MTSGSRDLRVEYFHQQCRVGRDLGSGEAFGHPLTGGVEPGLVEGVR
jgi:hypothetical protein